MLLYHYTIGSKLKAIYEDGFLKLTPHAPKLGEKPVVWLSSNPVFEKTASKLVTSLDDMQPRLMSFEVCELRAGGTYRFVFDHIDQDVFLWQVLKHKAKMPKKTVKRLVSRAKSIKAKPSEWSGTLSVLPIEGVRLERRNLETGEWFLADEADKYQEPNSGLLMSRVGEVPKEFRGTEQSWEEV